MIVKIKGLLSFAIRNKAKWSLLWFTTRNSEAKETISRTSIGRRKNNKIKYVPYSILLIEIVNQSKDKNLQLL